MAACRGAGACMLIRRYMRAHARSLLLLSALSGASAGVSILLLNFLNERAAEGLQGGGLRAVLLGCALLLGVVTVKAMSARVAAAFGSRLTGDLRRELGERFLALDIEKLLHRKHAVFGALIEDIGR